MIRFHKGRRGVSKSLSANFQGFTPGGGGSGGFSGFGGSGMSGGGGMGSMPGGGGGGNTRDGRSVFTPVFESLDEGSVIDQWISRSPERFHRIFKHIYQCDSVAGPAVELYKDMPWSDFSLVGIQDPSILKFYIDALNAIDTVSLLPDITKEFLVQGKVIGHMIMDEPKGYFTKVIIHDPDFVSVVPSLVPGFSPKMDLKTAPFKAVMMSDDPRDRETQQSLGPFAELIRAGKDIPLHPANSFYIPRQMSPYDSIGSSVYTRILHLVAYEKALINGTITTANRRLSRIRHITFGDENWVATEAEMEAYTDLFVDAEKDPVGAIVSTRIGVNVNEVGGNTLSDIIRLSDEWPYLQAAKMNALGISETFLTGEASYNSMDQVLSVFMDRLRAHREFITQRFMINEILKPLAKKHKYLRTTKASLDHRVRVAQSDDNVDYILPSIVFEKKLRPVGDQTYFEILDKLEEKGMPVGLRTWAATGGFDMQTEIDQQKDDLALRRDFARQKAAIDAIGGEDSGGDSGGGFGDFGGDDEEDDTDTDTDEDAFTEEEPAAEPEEPAAEEPAFELGASAKGDRILSKLVRLPHLRDGVFAGVKLDVIRRRADAVSKFLGGRKTKPMTASDRKRLLSAGTPQKTAVVSYLFARARLVTDVNLTVADANYIARALKKACANKTEYAAELSVLKAMIERQPKAAAKKLVRPRKFVATPPAADLLTGYVPKS